MRVVLFGAGGHARVVLDAARSTRDIEVIAIVDDRAELRGTRVDGVEVIGDLSALPIARERGATGLVLGVGSVDVGDARRALYERVAGLGFELPPVVHRAAVISPVAHVGPASVIFAAAVLNPGARLATNVIVNTAAIVEHDVTVGDHTHISPGAHLAGGVVVGERCHIGIGATVLQGVRIGDGAVIGAGAVVLRSVAPGDRVAGVPARSIARSAQVSATRK